MMSRHPLVDLLRLRDPSLAELALKLLERIRGLLALSPSSFPSGTDHTASGHTDSVEQLATMVLGAGIADLLNDDELFFLCLACHYHDLGMVGTVEDDISQASRNQTRIQHAVTVGERIRKDWKELGFADYRQAEILGEICRGHRPTKINGQATWDDLSQREIVTVGRAVRVRLLAALIYAIDELHLDAKRADEWIQRFRKIESADSIQHFEKHRTILGPELFEGRISFQIRCPSPRIEQNVRSTFLRKALVAYDELGRQLLAAGIDVSLPSIVIEWKRLDIWRLLVPLAMSDLKARSLAEITTASRVIDGSSDRESLPSICAETGYDDETSQALISRVVDDLKNCARALADEQDAGQFKLSAREKPCNVLFEFCREVDQKEDLLLPPHRKRWEARLFNSELGRTFVEQVSLPAIEHTYSVSIERLPNIDPIRRLLLGCPSAARVALAYTPSTLSYVKLALLQHAVAVGFLFDLHNDPELILSEDLRAAAWAVMGKDKQLQNQLRIFEELALLAPLTQEQVANNVAESETAEAFREVYPQSQLINVSQTIPAGTPLAASSIANLLAASYRARAEMLIAVEQGGTLSANVNSAGRDELQFLGIGGHKWQPRTHVVVRGRLKVTVSRKSIDIELADATSPCDPREFPILVRVPMVWASYTEQVDIGVDVEWFSLTIGALRSILKANQVAIKGDATLRIIVGKGKEKKALKSPKPLGTAIFNAMNWDAETIRSIDVLSDRDYVPHAYSTSELSRIAMMTKGARARFWKDQAKLRTKKKPIVNEIYFEIARDSSGKDYDRQPLMISNGALFSLTKPDKAGNRRRVKSSQTDLMWQQYKVSSPLQIVKKLLFWVQNLRTSPPPDEITHAVRKSPILRTHMQVTVGAEIDRGYQRVQVTIIRLRGVTHFEEYQLEALYWDGEGDPGRAKLCREIANREKSLEAQPTQLRAT
jgi:hypothetical protein